jgi:hypothetical protein
VKFTGDDCQRALRLSLTKASEINLQIGQTLHDKRNPEFGLLHPKNNALIRTCWLVGLKNNAWWK